MRGQIHCKVVEMFCTIEDCKSIAKKLNDLEQNELEAYLEKSYLIVITDLNAIVPKNMIEHITNSGALKLLQIYKTCEMALAGAYGTARRVDEVTDIQFFQKLYDRLLNNLRKGEVLIDGSVNVKNYPAIERVRIKLYNVKGQPGFFGDENISDTDVEVG